MVFDSEVQIFRLRCNAIFLFYAQIWVLIDFIKEIPGNNCSALMASGLKCHSLSEQNLVPRLFCAISRTNRINGFFQIRRFAVSWSLRISQRAPDPLRCFVGLLPPSSEDFAFRAALVASCLRCTFQPVDIEAICLMRAILAVMERLWWLFRKHLTVL